MDHAQAPRLEPELTYALHPLPPGRFGFRRWRWELWSGSELLASGWRTTERQSARALHMAAARFAHRRLGVHVLRPESAFVEGGFRAGTVARLRCGAVSCLLVPRAVTETA